MQEIALGRCAGLACGMALGLVTLLAGCGSGSGSSAPRSRSATVPAAGRLSLAPPAPTVRSRVTFSFLAPADSGRQGQSVISFALTVAGPRRSGCLGPRTASFVHVVKGEPAHVTLAGPWCVGGYRAQVQEFARAYCTPGQMCPQYVRLVATPAQTTFRVAAG